MEVELAVEEGGKMGSTSVHTGMAVEKAVKIAMENPRADAKDDAKSSKFVHFDCGLLTDFNRETQA